MIFYKIIYIISKKTPPKAEKAVSELTATDFNNENGMKPLIEKLGRVFESDKVDEAYLVCSRFINFYNTTDEMSMTDYIIQSEHLYDKMTNHEIPLPSINFFGWCKTQ